MIKNALAAILAGIIAMPAAAADLTREEASSILKNMGYTKILIATVTNGSAIELIDGKHVAISGPNVADVWALAYETATTPVVSVRRVFTNDPEYGWVEIEAGKSAANNRAGAHLEYQGGAGSHPGEDTRPRGPGAAKLPNMLAAKLKDPWK
jgi:hypothetical protein